MARSEHGTSVTYVKGVVAYVRFATRSDFDSKLVVFGHNEHHHPTEFDLVHAVCIHWADYVYLSQDPSSGWVSSPRTNRVAAVFVQEVTCDSKQRVRLTCEFNDAAM